MYAFLEAQHFVYKDAPEYGHHSFRKDASIDASHPFYEDAV
jgi:hypothetical protein